MKSKYTGLYFGKTRQDFDSDEELEIWCWLKEAEKANLLDCIRYQEKSFLLSDRIVEKYQKQLKTKLKDMEKVLFRPHKYTLDFEFWLNGNMLNDVFINSKYRHTKIIQIDVKGAFNKFGDPKQFSINKKWVYDKFGCYVEKIVPKKLFEKTWVPEIARLTPKTKVPSTTYRGFNTIKTFLK